MRMAKHGWKDFWVEKVTQERYNGEEEEENKVKGKENDGNDLKPLSIVGQLMKQDRYDSGAHGNDKPAVLGSFRSANSC